MNEPPSPTVGAEAATVVGADEQDAVDVDVDRWSRLAHAVLAAEGAVGELTLTFVDEDEIAALNAEHLGQPGPTDVLSFPLDALDAAAEAPGGAGVPNGVFTVDDAAAEAPGGAGVPNPVSTSERRDPGTGTHAHEPSTIGTPADGAGAVPVLLGDVVICPAVAAAQASAHAGTLDDELALLVVHGVLHVLGHDHAERDDTARMRARELAHLEAHHWGGPPPDDFRQEQP